ncbi:helix-turn-helix protein [Rhodoglobus vestalii]|uniref:Helix-turn-helix protein n=1 Tax=Rhodoglobus vestalii TaxID=193384 RepID=A0A8H2K6C8_9MICO|nr:helix-turn-helix transcriptional regulator [Rhodoglobus vestalii]TQO20668.1 helix-turn-helix protein [Rhodoglobus vestalii]
MEAKELVRSMRLIGGLSQVDLANLAGVAASTISRIERGSLEPTWSIMSRLLDSAGYRQTGDLTSLGDNAAVAAARIALGETIDARLDDARVNGWLERWKKARFIDETERVRDIGKLGAQAGIASRIFDRPNERQSVVYDRPWQNIVAALASSGVRYAVSGITATSLTRTRDGAAWPLIYVDSVPQALQAAELRPQATAGPRVTLMSFDRVAASGIVDEDGIAFVSPGQALIDSYAGPGRMADLADAVASRWMAGAVA